VATARIHVDITCDSSQLIRLIERLRALVDAEVAQPRTNPLVGYDTVAQDAETCANYYAILDD